MEDVIPSLFQSQQQEEQQNIHWKNIRNMVQVIQKLKPLGNCSWVDIAEQVHLILALCIINNITKSWIYIDTLYITVGAFWHGCHILAFGWYQFVI